MGKNLLSIGESIQPFNQQLTLLIRFASWQRGSNENFNGLLRQYIPKKRSLSTVTNKELKMIQDRLNNRPRKRLGFKTPNEVFMQSLNRVALRV
jgi:IS30 family transposase